MMNRRQFLGIAASGAAWCLAGASARNAEIKEVFVYKKVTVHRNSYSYCGPISMLKKLKNGDLILIFREALWRGFVTHSDPTTRTSLIRSTDNGETWHTQVTPDPAGGNGTAINQLSDGTLIANNFHWKFVPLSRKSELQGMGGVPRAEKTRFGYCQRGRLHDQIQV